MKIGFSSIYSWRPHVEFIFYLSELVRRCGVETEFLTCDGAFRTCYTRELRNAYPDWLECFYCQANSIDSFANVNITKISRCSADYRALPKDSGDWGLSSASTLGRFESQQDFSSDSFNEIANRIQPTTEKAYNAALDWIIKKDLDGLVVFNGRIDATRAIIEAAKYLKIPYATVERTWFGDGLQILPGEDCLGLRSVDEMVAYWAEKPLTNDQALKAAKHIAARFTNSNHTEWRAYNQKSIHRVWPVEKSKHKILILPGSMNEIWGHKDWSSDWSHPVDAYDAIIKHLSLESTDLILRCHPNWSENIGKTSGDRAEAFYTEWANKRGIKVLPSSDNVSTCCLIEQAEAIIVASGSAALEAGALGKQIIGVGSANYQKAGIRDDATSMSQLKKVRLWSTLSKSEQAEESSRVSKKTLRFAYTVSYRIPQYTNYVKCITPTRYKYLDGADGYKLINALMSGKLTSDDLIYSYSEDCENSCLNLVRNKQWDRLVLCSVHSNSDEYSIQKRFPYSVLGYLRNFLPAGDR